MLTSIFFWLFRLLFLISNVFATAKILSIVHLFDIFVSARRHIVVESS